MSDEVAENGIVAVEPSRAVGLAGDERIKREDGTVIGEERSGYVPNVVYSCGAMKFRGRIVMPYAISDTFSTIATVKIDRLLEVLRPQPG